MNEQVKVIIEGLPRSGRRFPNAVVFLDAAGRLNIEVVGGGAIILEQDDLELLESGEDE